jgi:hypothetical protein
VAEIAGPSSYVQVPIHLPSVCEKSSVPAFQPGRDGSESESATTSEELQNSIRIPSLYLLNAESEIFLPLPLVIPGSPGTKGVAPTGGFFVFFRAPEWSMVDALLKL